MARHPYHRLRPARPAMPEVGISETGNIRSLHLGSDTIQSSMNLDNPTELVLSYSRAMMAWLLFADPPVHITQIGRRFVRPLDRRLPARLPPDRGGNQPERHRRGTRPVRAAV